MSSEKKSSNPPKRRITRREFVKAGLGAGGLAILAGCAPAATPTPTEAPPPPGVTPTPVPPTPTPAPPPKKMVLRMGLGQPVDWPSPLTKSTAPLWSYYDAVFEYLTWVDRDTAEIQPMLATSWRVLDDKLTWEFELQEGVKFHNGEEFDAECVKVSIESVLVATGVSMASIRLNQAGVERVEVVDKYKAHIITREPFVLIPAFMNEVNMYPAKHLSEVGLDGYADDPVGTGQFRVKRWDRGLKMVVERFEDHWGFGEPALVDEIEFRGYPEDATRVAALRADEADIIWQLPPDDAAMIEAEGLKVQWTEIGQGMLLNMRPREGNPFMDKRVRQAISYGIDVDSLIENVLLGFANRLHGQLCRPGTFGYNPDLKPYPYDPDKARELLKEAGYPDGFTTDFDISQGRYLKQKEMNEAIAGELAKMGVKTKINMLEWAVFVDKGQKTLDISPISYTGQNYFPAMDAGLQYQNWKSTGPTELFTVAPKEMDEAYEKSTLEFDPQKRVLYLQEFARIMREEAPCVFLFSSPDIFGVQPRVKGFVPTTDDRIHFGGIYIEE